MDQRRGSARESCPTSNAKIRENDDSISQRADITICLDETRISARLTRIEKESVQLRTFRRLSIDTYEMQKIPKASGPMDAQSIFEHCGACTTIIPRLSGRVVFQPAEASIELMQRANNAQVEALPKK